MAREQFPEELPLPGQVYPSHQVWQEGPGVGPVCEGAPSDGIYGTGLFSSWNILPPKGRLLPSGQLLKPEDPRGSLHTGYFTSYLPSYDLAFFTLLHPVCFH